MAPRRRRIVLINNQGMREHGGGPTIMRSLVARLSPHNDMTVVSFDPPSAVPYDIEQVALPPPEWRGHWRLAPLELARHYKRTLGERRLDEADILIAMDCHLAPALTVVPAKRTAYISLTCAPRQEWFAGQHGVLAKFVQYAWLERSLIRRSDLTVVASENQKREILRFELLPDFEPLVLPPVFPDESAPSTRSAGAVDSAVVILTLCRLAAVKRVDRVLAIAERMRGSGCRFVIVGDGPLTDSLRRQAESAGVGANVTFAGATDDPTAWLRQADILLHPSAYESFGIAVFEAMRHGVVPVVSDGSGSCVGIAAEIENGVNGMLADFSDIDGVVRELERLVGDEALRRRLAADAQRRATALESRDYVAVFAAALDLDAA